MHLRAAVSFFRQVLFQNLLIIAKSTDGRACVWYITPHGVSSIKNSSSSLTAVHQLSFFAQCSTSTSAFSKQNQKQHIFMKFSGPWHVTTFWSIPMIWGGQLPVTYPGIHSNVFEEEGIVLYCTVINFSRYYSLWFEWFPQPIPAFWSPWKYRP